MAAPAKKIDYTNTPLPKIPTAKLKPSSDEAKEKAKAIYEKNRRQATPHPRAFKSVVKQLPAKK